MKRTSVLYYEWKAISKREDIEESSARIDDRLTELGLDDRLMDEKQNKAKTDVGEG